MSNPAIPYDASDQTAPPSECWLSPNDHDFVVLSLEQWNSLQESGAITPGDPVKPVPSAPGDPPELGEGGRDGYGCFVSTYPVRADYAPEGTDLTFHRAGVVVCADGYLRPIWRSGKDGRYCIGEFFVWDQRDGNTQVGSGYLFGLMVNDQPETSLVVLSSDPSGIPT